MSNPASVLSKLHTAIVYDQATTQHGGAELVLSELKNLFPDAPLFTTVHDQKKAIWTTQWKVFPSGLQWLYRLAPKHEWLTPLMPLAIEDLSSKLKNYQLIISVSSGVAKGVITRADQLHVCYLLTPTRYLHVESNAYLRSYTAHSIARRLGLDQLLLRYLRRWDTIAGQRPDAIVTISKLVSQRTQDAYHRPADALVYPPIPLRVQPASLLPIKNYNLCVSRLVWYKRIDLAIHASLARGEMLIVIGTGSLESELQAIAPALTYTRVPEESVSTALKNLQKQQKLICFLGSVTDQEKASLYAHAKVFIQPGIEDFGLTAVEAASYGVASIIHARSGVSEVLPQRTHAQHISEHSTEALVRALRKIELTPPKKAALAQVAKQHHAATFTKQLQKTIYQFWKNHSTLHRC